MVLSQPDRESIPNLCEKCGGPFQGDGGVCIPAIGGSICKRVLKKKPSRLIDPFTIIRTQSYRLQRASRFYDYKSLQWALLAHQVYVREGCLCQDCKTFRYGLMNVHHAEGTHKPEGHEELAELVLLCKPCHDRRHQVYDKQRQTDLEGDHADEAAIQERLYFEIGIEGENDEDDGPSVA